MKILTSDQIRAWDQYTIQAEPISSIDLMERAATKCVEWLCERNFNEKPISIFCGKGNNGGDGLAIARQLSQMHSNVNVYILENGSQGSEDFQLNLERLQHAIRFIQAEKSFPSFRKNEIIIDALFGSGLNRPLDGMAERLVEHINRSGCEIISIDLPSGLSADTPSNGEAIIMSDHILSFQACKLAFLLPANAAYTGKIHILNIGLHNKYYESLQTKHELVDADMITSIYKPRNRFAHKGEFGHALLVTGSYGKMGAAVLCTKASLRSGVGLATCHIPKSGYAIMQASVPEAMVSSDFNLSILTKIEEDLSAFDCIGIGPGIGRASETRTLLYQIFDSCKSPLVIDADALNIISADGELMKRIPAQSLLTPHPKEFERLFGSSKNDIDRLDLALQKSKEHNLFIVLKGHHTFIACPDGKGYFNSTGNAGMATAGSGDVLTGILTSMISQGYKPLQAAILGVHLHGLAGDIAAEEKSMSAMIAGDIIENLGEAFLQIERFDQLL